MTIEKFKELAKTFNIVPVYEKITADLLTPVLAYLKIREKDKNCFLLESVEGIGRIARYSFIGKNPSKVFYNNGMELTKVVGDQKVVVEKNIFEYLKEGISSNRHPRLDDLPDFTGGIVGYLGYENISLFENSIVFNGKDQLKTPDSIFGVYDTLIAFDHYKHQIILITNVRINDFTDLDIAYNSAKKDLKKLREEIQKPVEHKSDFKIEKELNDDFNKEEFFKYVEKCKGNIVDGDVFQIVMSKRFGAEFTGDLLNVYRALRIINPSPYMYFMEYENDFTIIGTSPEDLLKVKDRNATILPIAGTRRRGKNDEDDLRMEEDLLNDPKEIAEHTMLVDLARNDLGRVCEYDSVHLTEKMTIHRFSHVMHIVSRVEGTLKDGNDCIDALASSFPAGTVTGAPKIRAIQLLNEYEKLVRNVYAGSIGYIDFNGNLDMCIAIRTLFAKDNNIYWQAGAGIVADSKPELELKEIYNKSAVLKSALEFAEGIDENLGN